MFKAAAPYLLSVTFTARAVKNFCTAAVSVAFCKHVAAFYSRSRKILLRPQQIVTQQVSVTVITGNSVGMSEIQSQTGKP